MVNADLLICEAGKKLLHRVITEPVYWFCAFEKMESVSCVYSVSYTHLDVYKRQVHELHKENGILLIPSRHDAHAVAMSEAASSGVVVVGSDVTSNGYFMNNAVNHTLADPEDSHALADIIERLYRCLLYTSFGYVGTISHWFDFEVLHVILEANPNNEIVLVGNNMMPEMKHERVHYVAPVKKEQVAGIIEQFDVCLYNFKRNDLLDKMCIRDRLKKTATRIT